MNRGIELAQRVDEALCSALEEQRLDADDVPELMAAVSELGCWAAEETVGRSVPTRYRLPQERPGWTHHFTILATENGEPFSVDGYITVNTYEDGAPAELFVKMERQGSQASGFVDAWAISMSMLLQLGVPLATLLGKFENMRFEPSGRVEGSSVLALSPIDYVCKYLRGRFPC